MNNLKKKPRKQLEKFSTVFMQLGLVLTMFVIYVTLEYETVEKKPLTEVYETDSDLYEMDFNKPVIFVKDVPKPKVEELPKPISPTDLSKVQKVDNDDKKVIATVIDLPKDTKPQIIDFNKVPVVPEDEGIDENDDPKNFFLIEEAPIYRGCEGLSKEENKKCFVRKITKHVQRHFNGNLGQDLGLRSGKHKIYAGFIIDKTGKVVDVKIKAPHKKLQKEAQRIVNKIPQFTPGKQRGTPVKVKYTLPITFHVE